MIVPDIAARLSALTAGAVGGSAPVAVAVSGGPDSLALLALAAAAFGSRVRALTVDHRLRAGSDADAAVAADVARELGVAHVVLGWDGAKPVANVQAVAREARYALLRDWCADHAVAWLVTAHHRDDVAETLLLRLARGAGVAGLGGIRTVRDLGRGVTLVRPLLDVSRADLAAIVAAHGWPAVDDPANRHPGFDRSHARALLAATAWLDPARLAASAAILADTETALAWTAALAWDSRVVNDGGVVTIDVDGLPHEIVRRLVVRAAETLVPATRLRGDAIERVVAALTVGSAATIGGVAARPAVVGTHRCWRFRAAPPRTDRDGAARRR